MVCVTSHRSVVSGTVGTYTAENSVPRAYKEWFVTLPVFSVLSDGLFSYIVQLHCTNIKNDLKGKNRKSRRFSKGSKYIKDLRNIYTTGSYTPHNRTRLQIGHTNNNK